MGCPSEITLNANLTFTVNTHDITSDAGASDADAVPAYRVYEEETGTAILTGNMAKLDDANTLGFYSEQIACTTANGFESGKVYCIYIAATVNSVAGGIAYTFVCHSTMSGGVVLEDDYTFYVTTHDTTNDSALTDADAVPTYRVYEDETGTAILNGSMAKLDDANTTGFYSEQIACSAANGFEAGKTYSIYVSSTVTAIVGTISFSVQCVSNPIGTPTGGELIGMYPLGNRLYMLNISAVTGATQGTNVYLHTASPATDGVLIDVIPAGHTWKFINVKSEKVFLDPGVTYYCITRPFNGTSEAANTTELSQRTAAGTNDIIQYKVAVGI